MNRRVQLCPTCGDAIRPAFVKVGHVITPPSAGDCTKFGEVIGYDGQWQILRITDPHHFHRVIRAGGRVAKHGVAECRKCGVVSVVSQHHKLTTREEDGITQHCPCGEDLIYWPSIFSI